MLVALAAAGLLLLLQSRRLLEDRSILPMDDFVEYWAAGTLNALGQNPYDPDRLLRLERWNKFNATGEGAFFSIFEPGTAKVKDLVIKDVL